MRKPRLSHADFLTKARAKHGEKYDYSPSVFAGVKTKVIIICPKHGTFSVTPDNHFQGYGCKRCGLERLKAIRSDTQNSFLQKARAKHGEKYDYSRVEYVGTDSKVTINCPRHGPFLIAPHNHLQGQGCKRCADDCLRKGQSDFIRQARAKHGEKYDYSRVEYKQSGINVAIVCLQHGPFQMTPQNHLLGQGCRKCSDAARRPCWTAKRWVSAQRGRLAHLYVVQMTGNGECFFKVGITLNTLHRRFLSGCPYKVEKLKLLSSSDALAIHHVEAEIKQQFRHLQHKPLLYFNGHTECYTDAGPILEHLTGYALAA